MNIEDLFNEFLIEKNEKMPNYGFQAWIRYFKANAQYRTICMDCVELIEDYQHKLRRQERRIADPARQRQWEADKEQPQNYRAYDTTQFARETFVDDEAEESVQMESQILDDPSLIDHQQIEEDQR